MHKNCCRFPETLVSYHNEVVVTGRGSLNETVPHRLRCLNAWSLVGSTVWVDVGGVALLRKCVTRSTF